MDREKMIARHYLETGILAGAFLFVLTI